MNMKNQDLLSMLDLEAAQIIVNQSNNSNFIITGAIFLIIILCYYFFIETRHKKIIKILKLVEKKPDYQNLLLGRGKIKDWLCYCNKSFAYMTELEIASSLRNKRMHNLADFIEASNNLKYQYKFCETTFNNILVSNAITEIENIKNGKSVFKNKL
jgi:hypothetical protein